MGEQKNDSAALLAEAGWLRGLVRGLARGTDDVDELEQATLLAAWGRVRAGAVVSRAWLAGTARRQQARAQRERTRRRRRERARARPEAQPSAAETAARAELQRRLVDGLLMLDEPYRETLRLRYFEELPPRTIAARTGAPVETVRTRLKRGLALLRGRLDAAHASRAAWLMPLVAWMGEARRAPARTVLVAQGAAAVVLAGAVGLAVLPSAARVGPPPQAPLSDAHLAVAGASPAGLLTARPRRAVVEASTPEERGRGSSVAPTSGTALLSGAREIAACEALEAIAQAQATCRDLQGIDDDNDRTGEHGYLAELAGGAHARTRLRLLSAPFRRLENGVATTEGYCFRMFLPGAGGLPLPEAEQGGPGPAVPDPDLAEQLWCCYAWPAALATGEQGHVLFVDQQGRVLAAANADRRYVGSAFAPPASAAFGRTGPGRLGGPTADADERGVGLDGQRWLPAALPAPVTVAVRVVDPHGTPLQDVQVWCLHPTGDLARLGGLDETASRAQAETLRSLAPALRLPVGASAVTDSAGSARLRGRASAGIALVISAPWRQGLQLPMRFAHADGALRIELDVPPGVDPGRVRPNANEAAAIATLKNIASAQAQCQAACAIDVDADGHGEYGYFGELAGGVPRRGSGERLAPPFLSGAFNRFATEPSPDEGVVLRSGYCFQLYLPDRHAQGVPEAPAGGAGAVHPDPDRAERLWCAYAWPAEHGVSGERAFFVDQAGDVLMADNDRARYSGFAHKPLPGAAYAVSGDGSLASEVAVNAVGRDGERWIVVN